MSYQNQKPDDAEIIEDEETCRNYLRETGRLLLSLGDNLTQTKRDIDDAIAEITGLGLLIDKEVSLTITPKFRESDVGRVLDGIQLDVGDTQQGEPLECSVSELGAKIGPSVAFAINSRVQNSQRKSVGEMLAKALGGIKVVNLADIGRPMADTPKKAN